MNTILILAYDFPPYVSVGGLRPYSWSKYFYEKGIYPIIVTRQWQNKYGNHLDYIASGESKEIITKITDSCTILRTPYHPNLANRIMLRFGANKYTFIRKFVSSFYEFFQWIFPIGPKYNIFKYADKYLKHNHVDAIIATGDPFILFKYGSKLGKKYNIPFIADYRDLWSHNSEKNSWFYFKWNKIHEKNCLNGTSAVICVSELLKIKISENYKSSIHIIPNGFDPEALYSANNINQTNHFFSIAIAGTIYPWHPIESFLQTIDTFVKQKKDLKINFFGINNEKEIRDLISNKYPNLSSSYSIYPKMPNEELMIELAKSNMLLLFNYYSFMGTKIYDYLALKRAILFCFSEENEALLLKEKHFPLHDFPECSDHLQESLIKKTNSGIIVKNKEHLFEVLNDLYKEFSETGQIACHSKDISEYSRRAQTEKLAALIQEIVGHKKDQ